MTAEASLWAAVFSWLGVRDGRALSPLRLNEFPYIHLHPSSRGKTEEGFLLNITPTGFVVQGSASHGAYGKWVTESIHAWLPV